MAKKTGKNTPHLPYRKEKPERKTFGKYRNFLVVSAIVIYTAILFSNSVQNGFVNWDDDIYITKNEYIKTLSGESVSKIFTSFYFCNYHPLTTLAYAVIYNLYGANPAPFHVLNLILHLLNTILVFILLQKLAKRIEISVIVAVFFAIHPMHVESVAWVSELKDVMYSFFFLGSLILYVEYVQKSYKIKFVLLSFVLFVLSLLSKSAAVVLPLLLFLTDYYLERKFTKRIILEKIPFFILSALFAYLTLLSQKSGSTLIGFTDMIIHNKLFISGYAVVYYILSAFAPFNLRAIHGFPDKSGGVLPMEYYGAVLVIAALIILIYKSGSLRKDMVFGALFFLISVLMVIQIIPIGLAVVSERYTYISYIGIFFITAKLYCYVWDGKSEKLRNIRRYFLLVLAGLFILFSVLTWERSKVWKDGLCLWTDQVEKDPGHYRGWWARGCVKLDSMDNQGAIADFNKSIERNAEFHKTYYKRGLAYMNIKRYEEAKKDFSKTLELNKNYYDAYISRGNIEGMLGQNDSALKDLNKAITLDSKSAISYSSRGNVYAALKKYDLAVSDFTTAVGIKPDYAEAYMNRGGSYLMLNLNKEACSDWQTALGLGIKQAKGLMDAYCK